MNLCRTVIILSKLNRFPACYHWRNFSKTSNLCDFWEPNTRGAEYPFVIEKPLKEIIRESGKAFIQESKLLWQETKDHFAQDRKFYTHGDTDVFWRFDSEDVLKQWRVSSDKTFKEGNSECNLIINDRKKAVFYGNVDLSVPKDGKKRFAGWCGMKSVRKRKSFYRDDWYYWSPFTHLELRVKGDGRNYAINLQTGMYFDVQWFTQYTHALFTHGGPYWQVVRIPFSKFFMQSKGRIQDRQFPMPRNKINSIGITCAGVAGPFRLEIDYIGCYVDEKHTEKHAYEMYQIPKEFVSY